MNVRLKIFLLLSLVLLSAMTTYVWFYSLMDHQRLLDEFKTAASEAEDAFRGEQQATEINMLQIATFIAQDQKVQQLFLLGKKAVALSGGSTGDELANQVRQSLLEYVQGSQQILADKFGFRQLHFHFEPGSLSFLRVYHNERYGDRMDNIRFTVVAANAEQKDITGFETGRIVSGIRGVAPMYATDSISHERIHLGALEAETSFATTLSRFHSARPSQEVAVLLTKEHLETNLWPEFLDKLLKQRPFIKGYRVEGTTSPAIEKYLTHKSFSETILSSGQHLLQDGESSYNVISFPLRDFHGEQDSTVADAGLVVVWQEVSDKIAAFHDHVAFLIFYGALLFIVIEVLMYYALKLVTTQLQQELLKTQKKEVKTQQARLVAEESSRSKTEFLNNMSHEIRTPMNTIMGLGRLLSETSLNQQQQNYIDKINLSSKDLLSLIDDILLIANMESQSVAALAVEEFNPEKLLRRVVDNFSRKAKNNDVALHVNLSSQLPHSLEGSPKQIEWALNQLIENALKFNSGHDVVLSLQLLEQNNNTATLEFAVTDKGIGIADTQKEKIFQPFYQGDGSKTRAYGGTGLGLTIVQKICQQLGGELTLESTLGHGSRFSFCLTFQKSVTTTIDHPVTSENLPQEEISSALPLGDISELVTIIHQLEEPLHQLQAISCQKIALSLADRQWPAPLNRQVQMLRNLIQEYRFIEAQTALQRLKQQLV
ncbi:Signal transduction histidine kinase [Desulfuromusa kysingii]|uniref:histidine kinase n=2 Tax=Desulfuromusa kysingii TaxID=37625 RepID=A0A1H4AQZ9_9BACT|nr:Signal transduction histidine kinase [Desulfuromusa kysingii]